MLNHEILKKKDEQRSPGPRPGCDVVCLLLVFYTAVLLVILLLVLYISPNRH